MIENKNKGWKEIFLIGIVLVVALCLSNKLIGLFNKIGEENE